MKGWTRSTVILTILLAASEMDLSDDLSVQKLLPLAPVLDKCWMIPVHVSFLHSINVLNDMICDFLLQQESFLSKYSYIPFISFFVFRCICWSKISYVEFAHPENLEVLSVIGFLFAANQTLHLSSTSEWILLGKTSGISLSATEEASVRPQTHYNSRYDSPK